MTHMKNCKQLQKDSGNDGGENNLTVARAIVAMSFSAVASYAPAILPGLPVEWFISDFLKTQTMGAVWPCLRVCLGDGRSMIMFAGVFGRMFAGVFGRTCWSTWMVGLTQPSIWFIQEIFLLFIIKPCRLKKENNFHSNTIIWKLYIHLVVIVEGVQWIHTLFEGGHWPILFKDKGVRQSLQLELIVSVFLC